MAKTVIRTEQIWIKPSERVREFCHASKNLYNETNYLIRQELFKYKNWLRYIDYYHLVKTSPNYKKLPAQTAQQILRLLETSWKIFFNSITKWRDHPKKYFNRPRPPKYKKKTGEHLLIFTNQQVKLRNFQLMFPKNLNLCIKTRLANITNLREVRIIPQGSGYIIEIVYNKKVQPLLMSKDRVIGIDLGVTNLVTMVNNIGKQPIVIKGGVVKSINQFYNKERARLHSIYDRQISNAKIGKKLFKLTNKRNRKLHDQFHKISRKLIDYCVVNNIGTLVVGYNKN
jgi:transposase